MTFWVRIPFQELCIYLKLKDFIQMLLVQLIIISFFTLSDISQIFAIVILLSAWNNELISSHLLVTCMYICFTGICCKSDLFWLIIHLLFQYLKRMSLISLIHDFFPLSFLPFFFPFVIFLKKKLCQVTWLVLSFQQSVLLIKVVGKSAINFNAQDVKLMLNLLVRKVI